MMRRLILFCSIVAAALSPAQSQAASSPDAIQCESWIRAQPFRAKAPARMLVVSTNLACFDGEIEKESAKPLLEWLVHFRKDGARPLLVVRSGGGDAAVGINLMDKLQSIDAAVRIVDLCASSCANYLFAGAEERTVTDGALLLVHGGYSKVSREGMIAEIDKLRMSGKAPASVDWTEARRSILADVDRNMARQNALYAKIGVNDAIVRVDSIDGDTLSEADCDPTRATPRNFLFFSVPQLAALGIHIKEGRPASGPRAVNTKLRQWGAKFEACIIPPEEFERLQLIGDDAKHSEAP